MRAFVFLLAVILLANVSASDYSIEFNQFGNDLVVVEFIGGIEQASYVLKDELATTSSGYVFLKKIVVPDRFDNFQVLLVLEKGVLVDSEQTFPKGSKISSNGELISLVWNYSNVSKDEEFAFFVSLNDNRGSLVWIIFIVIIFFIGILIFVLRKIFFGKNISEKYLLDEEIKIIGFLKNSERHESWQRKIQGEFNLSKAKTSRLIRNLESRNLIEKIPFGNTNKIRLK